MFKSLKKVVAIIVTLAFALSLVPGYAFASVEEPATVTGRVGAVEYAYSRTSQSGVVAKDTAYKSTEYNGLHSVYMGGIYDAYMKMDLSGYEEILKNPSTTAEMRIEAGLQWSTAKVYDYRGFVGPDAADVFTGDTITWNIANNLGLLREAEDNLLFIKSDGTNVDANTEGVTPINMDVLLKALDEGTDNSYVSIHIDGLPNTKGDNGNTANSTFRADAADTGIFITYDESEIDNQAYVDELAAGMKCEDVLGVSADNVSADLDLPAKWHGAGVTWASTNPAVINPATGEVSPAKGSAINVTLTATLSYKGLGEAAYTSTASFDVTVPAMALSKITVPTSATLYKHYTRGGDHANNVQDVPGYGDYPVQNNPGYMTNDKQSFFKIDLSGYEKYINAAKSVTFNLKGNVRQVTNVDDMEVALISAKNDTAWTNTTLTHKLTTDTGMHNEPGYFAQVFEISRDVKFSSADLASGLKQEFIDDPSNSTVTFRFRGHDNTTVLNLHYPEITLEIEYYEDEATEDAFINDIKGKLSWNTISNQDPTLINENISLPKTYYGYPVTWSSSNDDVIVPSDGTVNVSETTKYDVTLTATINYGTTTEAKEFDLVVPKKMVSFDNIYDGTKALGTVNVTSTVEANCIGGKAPNDSYINFANTDHTAGSYYALSTSTAAGQDDVLEFSALVPESSPGMHFYVGIFGTSGQSDSTRTTLPFTIKADGIYYGYPSQGEYKIVNNDGTKWTNYAIVAPKGMTGAVGSDGNSLDDETYEVYVNGVKVFEHKAQITNGGFAYLRFYTKADSIDDTTIYFDNVRVYSGEYVPQYDTLSAVETTNGIVDDNIVLEDASAKLADVIGDITVDEDAVIRVYGAEGNLVTDYTLPAVGKTIVVADRNGTTLERAYSVYNIVSANGKDVIFGTPAVTYVNGYAESKISVLNNTNDTVTYNVYLAVYQGDELVRLVPETLTAEAGKTATVTPKASININQTVKLLVWDAEDGISPEIKPGQYN